LSLTAREKRRLRVFKERGLGRIFGSERDEVICYWRRLHNEELCALYASPHIIGSSIQEVEMGKACSTYEIEERCIQGSGGKT
jgi:hypothetical protein